ncbi:helix-turn-helix domain-containing protein [Actinoplanes sp. NPDC051475]|uniref:helix-turn-helix domain-containing protein n=1 Tax=Actinoplanes sp. NPDC051475 TaxID=3157225 RepID=UPI00344CBF05
MEPQNLDFVYTVAEAARQLKIGRTAMYELVMSGRVRSVTIGRCRRIPASCIAAYLAQLLEQPEDLPPPPEGNADNGTTQAERSIEHL